MTATKHDSQGVYWLPQSEGWFRSWHCQGQKKQLVTEMQEPKSIRQSHLPESPGELCCSSPLAMLVSYSPNTHKQLLKIPKHGRKSTLWSLQNSPRLSLKYCSHLPTLSSQVFNPKTIYRAPRQRAIFLSWPLFPDPWNEVSGISSLFPLCLSPADLIFRRRFPEPITAASGGQAESANASSGGLGPGDKCPQH